MTTEGRGSVTLPAPAAQLAGIERAREAGGEQKGLVRLNHNERLEPLPSDFMEGVRDSLDSALLMQYPDQTGLRERLCRHLDVAEKELLLTAGCDAAVKALFHAYARPGDRVVMLDPSYAMYPVYARMFGADVVSTPFSVDLELDEDALVDSVSPGVRLVVIANPNQPTATLLDQDTLLRLLEKTAEVGALLVVDEAYYPFSHTTCLPWTREFPNLVVLRSLSKAAGLAGLRIGFAVGHPDVIANLFRVRSVYDVNSAAILCASRILDDPSIVGDYVASVEAGRQLLVARAEALGLVPLPTHTNFILVRVAPRCRPAELVSALRENGYLVKGAFNAPCLADCIRVTLGPPGLMAAFSDVLGRALSEIGAGAAG
ncbi:MAG: histidinol-phosphate aminotransferase family protein [Gemmatimonadetes bacterium]|nr:histidinol-phosphate aminotransferase family protein [Gemmatimonadota bacterium]